MDPWGLSQYWQSHSSRTKQKYDRYIVMLSKRSLQDLALLVSKTECFSTPVAVCRQQGKGIKHHLNYQGMVWVVIDLVHIVERFFLSPKKPN